MVGLYIMYRRVELGPSVQWTIETSLAFRPCTRTCLLASLA